MSSELPMVSIVTPTMGRKRFFHLQLYNFVHFDYPAEKLEWIIVDDSNTKHQNVIRQMITGDFRIKYYSFSEKMSIAQKRNICVQNATYDYIVHMDDDDYYPPESLLTRIKLLLKYKDQHYQCIGCTQVGIYNLMENYSYIMDCKYISEASMAYTRNFGEQCPFQDVLEGEGVPFIKNRTSQVLRMPYIFNFIALTHHKNITGKLRTLNINPEQKYTNFFNWWDFDTQLFFINVLKNIKKTIQK